MIFRRTPIALLLVSLLPFVAAAEIRLDTPRAGWREGSAEGAHFMQAVNYPASSVNSAVDQAETTRIRGLIQGVPKVAEKPARLIVNGISMPLKVQEDGRFDRPFVFPSGSNNVEVRSPDGQQTRRVQFYNQGSGETPAKLRVVLAWDTDNTDLDLHLVTPDGGHVWYGERGLANGAALDVDVTTGYGPEMIASPTPQPGQYLVYVNYYGGAGASALTTAQITLISQEGTINERQESYIVPMRSTGELTLVKSFSYP
ncbi:MAG: DUF2135 domain-containing protein [Pseudomonas sp.]|uniref:YfaP family protein n=1 Tax=Pseudomonas sp. TaxID=306 RepID=UPI00272540A1|nr:DUF2135 domain-containing protein [Pseudomonas sp.]MDO9618598.1 DUF2135 domain-containing protein [Pseudomonas sp.]MDP2444405.1 DUF2135 domain-containing protein [Pseudomonas sp.]MDZ4336564.1 DUF2135 domain-containing protein [Pseudomonas sp.]